MTIKGRSTEKCKKNNIDLEASLIMFSGRIITVNNFIAETYQTVEIVVVT